MNRKQSQTCYKWINSELLKNRNRSKVKATVKPYLSVEFRIYIVWKMDISKIK